MNKFAGESIDIKVYETMGDTGNTAHPAGYACSYRVVQNRAAVLIPETPVGRGDSSNPFVVFIPGNLTVDWVGSVTVLVTIKRGDDHGTGMHTQLFEFVRYA